MMMAPEPGPPPQANLTPATREAVTDALARYAADGANGTALQDALRLVAHEARESEMRAEHLLVTIKQIWYTLPPVRRIKDGPSQARLLEQVVSACIREYYRADGTS